MTRVKATYALVTVWEYVSNGGRISHICNSGSVNYNWNVESISYTCIGESISYTCIGGSISYKISLYLAVSQLSCKNSPSIRKILWNTSDNFLIKVSMTLRLKPGASFTTSTSFFIPDLFLCFLNIFFCKQT